MRFDWKRLIFGVKPEEMLFKDLVAEVRLHRLLFWVWMIFAIFVLLGVLQQHSEVVSCWNSVPLVACRESLNDCLLGFKDAIVFNLSVS